MRSRLGFHVLFWLSACTAFWGAFEQTLQAGNNIWSGVFGFPFLHHWEYGMIGMILFGYFVFTWKEYIYAINRVKGGEYNMNENVVTVGSTGIVGVGMTLITLGANHMISGDIYDGAVLAVVGVAISALGVYMIQKNIVSTLMKKLKA